MADNQVIVEFVSDTSGLKAAADQLLALGQISKEQYEAFTKANKSAEDAAKRATKAETDLTKATQQATKPAKELSDQYRDLVKIVAGGVIEEVGKDFQFVAKQTEGATKQFASAKAELKELTKQITSGQLSGQELQTAIQRAGELKDRIGDVGDEIRAAASDTRTFDLAAEGVTALASAFSLVTSASALFGEKNEELEKALLKVQAAMALATSAQQLAEIATKKGGIATVAYGNAVKLVEGIQKAFAISSAAAWAAATGGITLAVGALAYFISSSDDADESSKELNKTLKEQKDELEKLEIEYLNASGQIDNYTKSLKLLDLERQRQLATIRAEAEEKALKDSKGILTSLIGFINPALAAQMQVRSFVNGFGKEMKSNEKKIQGINAIFDEQRKIIEAENIQDQKEKNKKAAEEAQKREKEKYDFINAQNKKFIEEQIKMDEMRLGLAEENSDAQLEIYREIIDGKKALAAVDPDLSPAMKEAIYATLEADYKKYRDNILLIGAQATMKSMEQDKAALAQLKTNRELEEGLIKDFGLTREQIDEEYAKSSFETFAEYEKKKREELQKTTNEQKKEAEKRKEIEQAAIQAAQDISNAIFAIEANRRNAQFEAELADLDKRKNSELANKELTEAQRENIEKKYQRQAAEIKKKQWQAEKQAAITQAIINGALAFVKALPNYILAATVAVATGAQIAVIASQKVPQFAKGTKKAPAGMKWVGEQGPELINDKGGYAIIPNKEAMQIAQKWNVPTLPSVSDDIQQNLVMPAGIDYSRLARTLAMELKNNPQTNIQFDKSGFTSYIISQSQRKQILNNRYAS